MTRGLEGRRSIQLSYGRTADPAEMIRLGRSGRSDSNRGLPAPKAGALTGLRHAPLPRASNYNRLLSVSQSPFCGSFVKASLTACLSEEADLCEECGQCPCAVAEAIVLVVCEFCEGLAAVWHEEEGGVGRAARRG